MGVFKAYDVRGIYPTEINEDLSYKIGKAYVQFLGAKRLLVGMDMRGSSFGLAFSLIKGITEMGCDVEYLDLCTTPMTYFATQYYQADGAIMVTASHNPKEYNGLKFSRENAIPVGYESGLQIVKELVENDDFTPAEKPGNVVRKEILRDYSRFITSHLNLRKPLKVIVDASNGMAGHVLPSIFYQVELLDIVEVHFNLDGNFPNHEANPLKTDAYRDLKIVMDAVQADLAVMFDGDADRVGFMDHTGRVIPADIITALLADYMIQPNSPYKEVVYDVRSSRVVEEIIAEKGGVATLNRVGHAFMKKTLREHDALIGGELAGHFYFRDFFFADSAIFAFVQVLNILSRSHSSFYELVRKYQKYFTSGEINFKVSDPDLIVNQIIEEAKLDSNAKLDYTDGIRIDFPKYWVSIRKSNTEPLLRLVLEAETNDLMLEKTNYYKSKIESFK
ncbi:phosphomannomutase/phosphoglucomutase [bacterium]|nr:phosphomannomutase/phosphoglucomutase [bacterium]